MRKVYQPQSNVAGLAAAVGIGASLTAVLFCVLPFSHMVNKPSRSLELRKAGTAELPPPVEDTTPPPPREADKVPEAPPEPLLADAPQQIPLSADLDVAAGSGGALVGFGEVRALTAATAVQQDAFDVADLEKRPEMVSQIAPAYPPELRKAKIEGAVTLVFILDEEGRVADPRVENSSRPEFEKPALDAIRRWRFRPGMKDGKAVRTYIRIPIRFRVASGA
ncbi:MAG: energy transducer TonB [Verrucomicrobia bacterium]|nr:MAG: energy transducer TonB [Verrucomicrobiota bacterium]